MAKNELKIDSAGVARLIRLIDKAGESFPDLRRQMFERLSETMSEVLDRSISTITPGIQGHTVQDWQDDGRVGSRGGYAAISPRAKTFKQQGAKQYAVGWLTNTLTHGTLNVRRPSWRDAGYVRRIKYGQIRRRPFYTAAARDLDRQKDDVVSRFVQELAEILEGGGA